MGEVRVVYRVWYENLGDRDHWEEACTGFGAETWETATTGERRVQVLVRKPGRKRPPGRGVYRVWWENLEDRDQWGEACTGFGAESWETETTGERRV
jgi:hypothetical protein